MNAIAVVIIVYALRVKRFYIAIPVIRWSSKQKLYNWVVIVDEGTEVP